MKDAMIKILPVFITIFSFLFSSCKETNQRLEYALAFAGDNRLELEKVLTYYKDDSLKLKACCFLIENMPRYFSYTGHVLDSIKAIKASVDKEGKLPDEKVDPLKGFTYNHLPKIYDAHVITADYLIENIDLAFEEWEKRPWNNYVSFDGFCELILPYRIDNEPLENWRRIYRETFSFLLDSVYTGSDVIKASNVIGQYLRDEKFIFNRNLNLPHLGAQFLLKHRVGKCIDSCDFLVYVLRSLGIPVAVDELPFSPDHLSSHTWNVVLDTTHLYVPFWFTEKDAIRGDRYDDGRKRGKVFRTCFGMQPEPYEGMMQNSKVPSYFKNPFRLDVSKEYFQTQYEVLSEDESEEYMYLGIFSPRRWVAVDMAKVVDGKAVFRNIESDIAYQPLYFDGKRYWQTGYPFTLKGDSSITFIPDKSQSEPAVLTRKCPLYPRITNHMTKVVGAKVYGSLSKDFQHKVLLYHIVDTPKVNINTVRFKTPIKCHYIRYVAPDNLFVEIADLNFYYKDQPLKAIDIYESDYEGQPPADELPLCMDHDPLTLFLSRKKGSYITMDFGKEVLIDRMVYIPRNDDNFIRIGDVYELRYQAGNEGWVYVDKQKAVKDTLIFDKVPKGALFHLRDLTRGKEEKVFYIENGKQVFP